ncbi:MAG: hypothetical protein K0S45_2414, partial [Nitrospira sp.]|nr:hypothetical protein [Nitrospira sp.]
MANTVTTLAIALGQLLSTLKEVAGGAAQTKTFINFLGWRLPPGLDDIGLAAIDLSEFLETLRVVVDSSDVEWNDELIMAARIGNLALAMSRLVQQIQQLAETIPSRLDQQEDYIARTNIHKELPRRIFDLLVASYLSNKSYLVSSLLHLVNILEFKHFEADEANYQVEHIRAIVHYDHLHAFLSDPSRHMQQTYGWGTAAFAGQELIGRIDQVLRAVGASVILRLMDQRAEEVLLGRPLAAIETDAMPQLLITLYEELGAFAGVKAGLSVFALRPSSPGGSDGGIGLLPFARGHGEGDIPLHLFKDTVIEFSAHADLLKRIALLIRPDQPPRLKTAHSLGELADGRFAIGIRHGRPETAPQTLVTLPGGSSLSFQQFRLTGGMEKREGVSPESFLELGLLGCRVEYSLGEADAFLSESISRDSVAVPFDLRLGWSSAKGIYFHGSGGLHATLPLHLALGPLLLESLYLALDTKETGFDVETSTSGRLSLGPLTVTVERIGLSVNVSFQGGNLGLFGLSPRFKPPTGLGLAIAAPGVVGGGFLGFDPQRADYSGILQLELAE